MYKVDGFGLESMDTAQVAALVTDRSRHSGHCLCVSICASTRALMPARVHRCAAMNTRKQSSHSDCPARSTPLIASFGTTVTCLHSCICIDSLISLLRRASAGPARRPAPPLPQSNPHLSFRGSIGNSHRHAYVQPLPIPLGLKKL